MVTDEARETSRTLEVGVAEHHDQLHIAVIHESGEDYVLLDKDRVSILMDLLLPHAPADWLTLRYLAHG
jgi:hypothetical protein